MSDDVTIKIVTDAKTANTDLNKTAASLRNVGAAGTQANAGAAAAATGFKGLVGSLGRVTSLFGMAGIIGGLFALVGTATRLYGIYKKLTEVNREYAAEAKRAADAANELGLTAAGLEAINQAAAEANIPADQLNETLKKYKDHTLTFDELAASVGKTADELKRMEDESARQTVGTRYLGQYEARKQAGEASAKAAKIERSGIKAITEDIRKGEGTDRETKGWDLLFDAAGGSVEKVTELYNANKSMLNRTAIGVLGFGTQQLPAGRARWEGRQEQDRADKEAVRAAHDKAVTDKRAAEEAVRAAAEKKIADADAARDAEALAKRKQDAHDREVRYDEAQFERAMQKRADAADDEQALNEQTAAKKAAITVDAPRAASAAASIGGVTGGMMSNASRLADQRAAAMEAIQNEHTRLLSEIKTRLEE